MMLVSDGWGDGEMGGDGDSVGGSCILSASASLSVIPPSLPPSVILVVACRVGGGRSAS